MKYFRLACLLVFPLGLPAWTEHALGTYPALEVLPQTGEKVTVETLAAFLAKEKEALAKFLAEEEAFLSRELPSYPVLAEELKFDPAARDLQLSFLRAIRVNPEHRTTLYLHQLPGEKRIGPAMAVDKISLLPDDPSPQRYILSAIQPGMKVSALAVVATASDEPDAGLDISIWEDSETDFGESYKFGKQSFGNPALSYSSQAPFHMGFYHESGILYAAAPFIKRTYPDVRIRQFARLSRFAFDTGHPYWGWRFAGWGLHYVQDLTQPYHSALAPGRSTLELLWTNILDMLGFPEQRQQTTQLLSNRHGVIENFQYSYLTMMHETGKTDASCFTALRNDSGDPEFETFTFGYIYDVLTRRASDAADLLDAHIAEVAPDPFVNDPAYNYDQNVPGSSVYFILEKEDPAGSEQLKKIVDDRMLEFGAHSRNYIRAILENRI